MMASKLKLITLLVSLTAILFCAWAKPLDTIAKEQVDAGFKRALISFGSARVVSAAISFAQDVNFSAQPFGFGVEFSPGQALHSIGNLVDKFADLMLAATVIFGSMKMLLIIGGSFWVSLAVTGAFLVWGAYYLRGHPSPIWLSKLVIILLLTRFSVPIAMVGSDLVYQQFLTARYTENQSVIDKTANKMDVIPKAGADGLAPDGNPVIDSGAGPDGAKPKLFPRSLPKPPMPPFIKNLPSISELVKASKELPERIINLIVVFLLQTLVIPLFFFWALCRVLMAMFQTSESWRANKTDERAVI
jgi:hypothetical protein